MILSRSPFDLYSAYYDLLYADKNYEEEANYILSIINKVVPGVTDILELGSGTGSHAFHFCRGGYKVFGVELSERMIEVSRQKNIQDFLAVKGDIRYFEAPGRFNVAVALFHVMSYLVENNDMLLCLQNVHRHLNNNGIFVFDVWYTPAVYSLLPEPRIKNFNNEKIDVIRKAKPEILWEQNIVDVLYDIEIKNKETGEIAQISELHSMRHFSTPEIALFAAAAGFKLIRSEAFLTKQQPGPQTWGVCYILQKYD